jgi:hypothetical protein
VGDRPFGVEVGGGVHGSWDAVLLPCARKVAQAFSLCPVTVTARMAVPLWSPPTARAYPNAPHPEISRGGCRPKASLTERHPDLSPQYRGPCPQAPRQARVSYPEGPSDSGQVVECAGPGRFRPLPTSGSRQNGGRRAGAKKNVTNPSASGEMGL